MKKYKPHSLIVFCLIIIIQSCATIVNDPTVPVALSFSDGSNGSCNLSNKRIALNASIPGTHNIRRSDDDLRYDCETEDGKKAVGTIKSSIEGEKLGASVVFIDLGITDAITDKHRTYPSSFVIPVK